MARQPRTRERRQRLIIDRNGIGATGLRTSGGYLDEEFLPLLRGERGRRIYREMQDNDPVIGAMLFAVSMLIRNAEWRLEPADDSGAAAALRDWCEEMFFERMEHTWADFVDELCSMFTYGFALHEMLWRRGQDGRWEVRALPLRGQETIARWTFDADTDELVSVDQDCPDRPAVTIPYARTLHFRTSRRKNNPEGRSLLRNCVVPWSRKKVVEEAEGSAAIRSAGIVVVTLPAQFLEPDADTAERATADALRQSAEKLARDKSGSIVLPSDLHPGTQVPMFDVQYRTAESNRPADMSGIVERLDRRMAMSILAQFIFLGQEKVGSFALSSDQTELFSNALGAWLGAIRDECNRRLIGTLAAVNGIDPALMPAFEHGDVESADLGKLGQFVRDIAGVGILGGPDPELDNALRAAASLPPRTDEGDMELVPGRRRPATGAEDRHETPDGTEVTGEDADDG